MPANDVQDEAKPPLDGALNTYRDYLAQSGQVGVYSHGAMVGGKARNIVVFAVQFDNRPDLGKALGTLLVDFAMTVKPPEKTP